MTNIEFHSDPIDAAKALTDERTQANVAAIRKLAADMPEGEPGECDLCGEHSLRLVRGACAPCRDRHKLP